MGISKSKYYKEWVKQRNRINKIMRRAMARGYAVEPMLKETPKRLTKKTIENLKKITPEEVYKKAWYFGEYAPTEEGVSGLEGRRLERQAAAQKAKESRKKKHDTELPSQDDMFARTVVQNYISRIEQFPVIIRKGEPMGGARSLLLSWVNQMIKDNGYWGTSEMILNAESNGVLLTYKVLNYFEIAVQYIGMMITYLPEYGIQYGEEVMDRLDYIKAVSEKFEDLEDWNEVW